MTRRIVHPNCISFIKIGKIDKNDRQKIINIENLEWTIRKAGLAWWDFSCDICGEYIFLGERCIAESFGTKEDYYKPWEDQYIKEIRE